MNKLFLNTDIYLEENIKKTCVIYKEYAEIKVEKINSYIKLTFNNCKYDTDTTMKEFENYLINVENL